MGKTLKSYAQYRLEENMREYEFYCRKFKRLLLSMFSWENLPDGISERFIEESLYETGLIIFFKSNKGITKGSFVVTRATPIGYNIYNEPTGYRAYTTGGLIDQYVKSCDCVPIWNDYLRQGNMYNVNYFAKRISGIERTIDVNSEQLKHPYIITCPEGQQESVKQIMTKVSNGEPYVLVDEDFNTSNKIHVWDLKATNNIPQLEDTKDKIINDALTFFGINNVAVSKKERLIVSEAEQNNQQIELNKDIMLKPRQRAIDLINKKFNQNITVNVANSLYNEVQLIKGSKGGD